MGRKKGKIKADIQRLKEQKKENLSKMDEARKKTEKKHYKRLVKKNQLMIVHYEEEIDAIR